jgi:hypothetical protein
MQFDLIVFSAFSAILSKAGGESLAIVAASGIAGTLKIVADSEI